MDTATETGSTEDMLSRHIQCDPRSMPRKKKPTDEPGNSDTGTSPVTDRCSHVNNGDTVEEDVNTYIEKGHMTPTQMNTMRTKKFKPDRDDPATKERKGSKTRLKTTHKEQV